MSNIKLTSVNKFITCKLCSGYLIDATTVTECVHTFCKSCLVKHLSEYNSCPECNQVIHNSHPLSYCVPDRTMQDIVYKLVSNLEQSEETRAKKFHQQNSVCQALDLSITSSFVSITSAPSTPNGNQPRVNQNGNIKNEIHGNEQVNLHLERIGRKISKLDKCFVRCSSNVTIVTMKKYISKLLFGTVDKYNDIDILWKGELLEKEHTLKFIYVTKLDFDKNKPLKLRYRYHVYKQ